MSDEKVSKAELEKAFKEVPWEGLPRSAKSIICELDEGAALSRSGLILTKDLTTLDQLKRVGIALCKVGGSIQLATGDLLNYVRQTLSKKAASALAEELGYTPESARNLIYVSRRVKPSLRNDALDYHYFVAAAKLAPEDQKVWLARAATGKWSKGTATGKWTISKFRDAIQSELSNNDGEHSEDVEPADDPKEQAEKWVSKFLAEIKRRGPPTPSGDIADISDYQRDEIIKACSDKAGDWADFAEGLKSLPERLAPSRVASIVTEEPNEAPVEQPIEKSQPEKKETVH